MTTRGPDTGAKKAGAVKAVVFDVGRVIVQWDLRCLIEKVVHDPAERDWVLAHVVTPAWHFQHDAGRRIEDMVAERAALFPAHTDAIKAYATRFNETIPGRVPGTAELIERLSDAGNRYSRSPFSGPSSGTASRRRSRCSACSAISWCLDGKSW